MRFEDIELQELDINEEDGGNFEVIATDELIDLLNEMRARDGNTDLVGVKYDNEVWYNFYLVFRTNKKEIILFGTANNSEEDDWCTYYIDLTPEEEKMLMFKVIDELVKEIMDE